jgi:hypothetical protein
MEAWSIGGGAKTRERKERNPIYFLCWEIQAAHMVTATRMMGWTI